jgi:hypothetical protein
MKFLIDECLSPELARIAQARGYGESSHIVWLEKGGWKDWSLMPFILDNDWTFVTRNAVDFRGPSDKPGTKGQYAGVSLHAGLICLGGPEGMDLDMMRELFEAALDDLAIDNDLVNLVLEVTLEDDDLLLVRWALPDR